MKTALHYDVLVIGTGAAGLGLALSLARHQKIALMSKSALEGGSSPHAQGGIAAVMDTSDDVESHIQDTLSVGAGLCDEKAVRFTVEKARSAIEWLIEQGVRFDHATHQKFHLTREGGHSHRRVLHVADHTGSAVVTTLLDQVKSHENIDCFPETTAIDLIIHHQACYGVYALNNATGEIFSITAKATILATGGASHVYQYTTNPLDATGDGIAMAWRAGCRVSNLEFNQFHPTTLYSIYSEERAFLLTEALRGEGAILKRPDGTRFMPDYDSRAELAPRDIVARAIDEQLKQHHLDYVYLDISFSPPQKIKKLFPTIFAYCLKHGIDITQAPIPVVPAAHYTCGGVVTDLCGKTDILFLYAIGEVACTGLHGANRMASNSLLECLVFAMSAAQSIQKEKREDHFSPVAMDNKKSLLEPEIISALKIKLKNIMWNNVSIVRCNKKLKQAQELMEKIYQTLGNYRQTHRLNRELIEAYNMSQVSLMMITAALKRHESRGLHFNQDSPKTIPLLAKAACYRKAVHQLATQPSQDSESLYI